MSNSWKASMCHATKIIVNLGEVEVHQEKLTYAQLVYLAYPDDAPAETSDVIYTVTISHRSLGDISLAHGEKPVTVKPGMACHVRKTGRSSSRPGAVREGRIDVLGGSASLHPSIGNWSMACRPHYWIRNGQVVWAAAMSKGQMRAVFDRDQRDLRALHRAREDLPAGADPDLDKAFRVMR